MGLTNGINLKIRKTEKLKFSNVISFFISNKYEKAAGKNKTQAEVEGSAFAAIHVLMSSIRKPYVSI